MKGIVAVYERGAEDVKAEPGAPPSPSILKGEWVIPCFHDLTQFLGSQSFQTCYSAEVKDGCDPDELREIFMKRYSGIPAGMVTMFVTNACLAASELPEGTKVCIKSDGECYRLWNLEKSEHGPIILANFKPENFL